MPIYDTPPNLSKILAKHAPKKISALLEPAVGRGALIEALLGRLNGSIKRIVCVDTDSSALWNVNQRFEPIFGKALTVVNYNFLDWPGETLLQKDFNFDCVVMNPPFSGRLAEWVECTLKVGLASEKCRHVPIEAAFVAKGLSMLRPKGRLLAIVPNSLVASERMVWFRRCISEIASIDYVYELPKFSFRGVEARPYILVMTKSAPQGNLTLLKYGNGKPTKRTLITRHRFPFLSRYDYGYVKAHQVSESLQSSCSDMSWCNAGNVIDFYRGKISSPLGRVRAIHTNNYKGVYWRLDCMAKEIARDKSVRGIRDGDLIIKRVGRNCSRSIGISADLNGFACSDCLLLLRPKNGFDSIKILLAMRLMLCSSIGQGLLERGAGASYLTESGLRTLPIPLGIADMHPLHFETYQNAIRTMSVRTILKIENQLRNLCGIPE